MFFENDGKQWVEEEDKLLFSLSEKDLTISELVVQLRRTSSSIIARMKNLGYLDPALHPFDYETNIQGYEEFMNSSKLCELERKHKSSAKLKSTISSIIRNQTVTVKEEQITFIMKEISNISLSCSLLRQEVEEISKKFGEMSQQLEELRCSSQ